MKQSNNKKIQVELVKQYRFFYNKIARSSYEDALLFLVDDICSLPTVNNAIEQKLFLKNINKLTAVYDVESKVDKYIMNKIKQTKSYINSMSSTSVVTRRQIISRGSYPAIVTVNEIKKQASLLKSISPALFLNVKKEQVLPLFKRNSKATLEVLCKNLKLKIPKYKFKLVRTKRPWKNIVTFSKKEKKFIILININEKFKVWETYAYPGHEICGHVLHLDNARKQLLFKNNPMLNLISICTHDSFYTESVAQIIFYHLQKYVIKNQGFRHSFLLFNLRFLVRHHCLYQIIFKGISSKSAVNLHRSMIPYDKISDGYYDRLSKDSFFCAQIFNYSYALIKLKSVLDSNENISKKVIFKMMNEPFTYKDLSEYAHN